VWAATAVAAPILPRLDRDVRAEVAVIGGGFTGLSTAHFLAKAGLDCVVLDAKDMGWGASSRTGGFVSPRFRTSIAGMVAAHGKPVAERMRAIGFEAIDNLEQIVAELNIPCGFERCGVVVAAHNQAALDGLHKTAEYLRTEFGDDSAEPIDRARVAGLTGSPSFAGGTLVRSAGAIHPLNYVHGLAASLASRNTRLFVQSPVTDIRSETGGIVVVTPRGVVRARKAVIATNAYSGLTGIAPRLKHSVVPFQSAVIATAPLGADMRASVLGQGHMLSDTRRVLRWSRVVDDRLVFGGRGAIGNEPGAASYERLRRQMVQTFPQLQGVAIDFRWSGLVAMTLDQLPHIGQLGEDVYFALGYNGTGVSMSNLMGKYLAEMVQGRAPELGLLRSTLPRIPMYALRTPAMRVATAWLQALDAFM
jgi:gamma-glutamylputrescine oxidase